jgi:hypothetical protein
MSCLASAFARIFHGLPAATTDMAVLPGILGCRTLRRTVQVRLGPIPRYRGTVARLHAHLRGLATAIHEKSWLADARQDIQALGNELQILIYFPPIYIGRATALSYTFS